MATGLIGERSGERPSERPNERPSERRGSVRRGSQDVARRGRSDPAGLGRPGHPDRVRSGPSEHERRLPGDSPRPGSPRGVRSKARAGPPERVRSGPPGRVRSRSPERIRPGSPERARERERARADAPGLNRAGQDADGLSARRPVVAPARARSRTPFILLLLGLLGGGLVSLLLINTTLAQGAFRINAMQQKNAALSQQVQALQQQTAQEESPGSIAAQAERLGMRPAGRLRFVDLKTGRIYSQPASVPGVIPVPGYVP